MKLISNKRTGGYHRRKQGKGRSKYEETLLADLQSRGVSFTYEAYSVKYTQEHTYTPDFVLPNGIIVEAKDGEGSALKPSLDSKARGKMVRIKKQYPDLDIRFVFRTDQVLHSIGKKCSTWCKEHGFPYYIGESIPNKWFKESGSIEEKVLIKRKKKGGDER